MDVATLAAAHAVLDARKVVLQRRRRMCYINGKKQLREDQRVAWKCMQIALTIIALTSPDTDCVAAYLDAEQRRRARQHPCPSLDEVLDRYMAESPAGLAALVGPTGGRPRAAFAHAERFVKQYALQAWVRHENEAKGLAPSTGLVQRQVLLAAAPAAADNPVGQIAAESLSPPSTKWVQRFRRRWSLRRGSFSPRHAPPLHVLRQRAGGA